MNNENSGMISRRILIISFGVAVLLIAAGAFGLYRHQAWAIRTGKLNELKAIAELKCNQLVVWRNERLADARLNSTGIISANVLQWLKTTDDTALMGAILGRLGEYRQDEGYYNLILAAPDGRLLLTLEPRLTELEATTKDLVTRTIATRQPTFGDFFRCPVCHQVHLDVAAPILDEARRPVAVLILRSDPEKQLYPLIQTWPLPSRSAETLLLRREGADALFLNVLRHRSDPALTFRIPLTRRDMPVVQAALGRTGEFEGNDYRGVPVLADLRPVPGSPWFMVAKVDKNEILAEARYRGGVILLLVVLGILLTGGLAAFLFTRRNKNIYKALFRAERERREAQEETRATLYGIGDGVIATDAAGNVTRMNPVAASLTGWTEAEALGRPIHDVFQIVNEETRAEVVNPVDNVLRDGLIVGLANHTVLIARDGTERPIADSGAPIHTESGEVSGVVLVFRDQTAEREAQKALKVERDNLRAIMTASPVGLLLIDEDRQIIDASPTAERLFHRSRIDLRHRRCGELLGCVNRLEDPRGCGHTPHCPACPLMGAINETLASRQGSHNREFMAMLDIREKPERFWLRFSIEPVLLNGRQHVVVALQDITEQRRLEQQYQTLFREMLDGFALHEMILDEQGRAVDYRFLAVNPAFERITGLKVETLVGKTVLEVLPNTEPHWIETYGRVAVSGEPLSFENYHQGLNQHFQVTAFSPAPNQFACVFVDITERKRAETALQESEARLVRAQAVAHVGNWELDLATWTIWASAEACRIYGLGGVSHEFSLAEAQRICVPEDRPRLAEALRALLEERRPYNEEFGIMPANGTTPRVIHSQASLVCDAQGAPSKVLGVIQDITERKQAEGLLLQEQGLYKDLVNTIPAGMYRLRMMPATDWTDDNWESRAESHYTVDMASDRFCEITGLSRQEFMASAKSVPDRIHPDDHLGFVQKNTQAVTSLSFFNWEGRMVLPDRRTIWVHFESIPRLLDNGEVMWTGIVYDITERKQTEQEREAQREMLNTIFENAPYILMLVNREGRVERINRAGESMAGKPKDQLLGLLGGEVFRCQNSFGGLGCGRNAECVNCPVRTRVTQTFQTGDAFYDEEGQITVLNADATPRTLAMLISTTPIKVDMQEKVLVSIVDNTARKQAEQEHEKLQAQLLQSQKMESVGRLAGGVAHDFNNMLGVIIGHTELAMEQADLGTPLQDDLQEIQKAARRSADLTRQLLAFARKQTVSPRILDLNETVAGMLKMLRRLIGENIELAWKPGADLWPVKMDPSQVDQILANLSVNARDAITGVGSLTIETENVTLDATYCATHEGFSPGDYVLLAVSDTGAGMDKATIEHLFEPFFTTKAMGKGTGLGLATVYGAVRQNGGVITVYSEPGRGSTFRIYLPRADAAQSTTTVFDEQPIHGTETVLLAEDEVSILNLGQAILEKFGYTVLAARTPAIALELAARHDGPIHLLLTDVVMPGMNGKELLDQLATLRPGLKALFMSGYTADIIAHSGVLEAGIQFIQKPYSMQALTRKVREVLDA